MKKLSVHLSACLISLFFFACQSNVIYDDYVDIPDGVWHVDSLAAFNFEIEDTSATYKINYNIRYAAQYSYYNLYVTYYLEDSLENILASDMQNLVIFDKKTGEPLGDGLGDLFDREVIIFENYKFDTPSVYNFKIKQFMRMQELPGIISFGLKVEKVETE
jgi:gliding motility-associated lipoprotein GldH